MTNQPLKDGAVVSYQVLQNTITYQLRLASTAKGLWVCIEEASSIWKLTVTAEMVEQTIAKASAGKQTFNLKDFTSHLIAALSKSSQKWSIGIMTPIELQLLRGGTPTKQASNTKIYLILSDKENKFHYPFTFAMSELNEQEKLIEAIRTMKGQLQDLRVERADKSQSSFSIMSETLNAGEQLKMENEQMKRKIKLYEDSLTQKRGAVEIDIILKEKNNLELQAQTKKRQENKEIARLKNIFQMMDRQINEIKNEVEGITKELLMLEDSVGGSAKLKSHALKVLRSYETELRTQKKILQKQVKEIQTVKRNILNSKGNQRKVLTKIKQIQTEIDQATKKANIKEISNRLHSVGRGGSSNGSQSSKEPSVASSQGKPGTKVNNIVRDNLLKKNNNIPSSSQNRNNLLRTSPQIAVPKKSSDEKMPARAINSSYQVPKPNVNPRLFNTQKYRSGSKSDNENSSVRSASGEKKEVSQEEKDRQKRAMERLTGANKRSIPKAPAVPSIQKRGSSFNKPTSLIKNSNSKEAIKKDSAKDMLSKMKEVKAHYNSQVNKNQTANRALNSKITQLTDKKLS